MRETEYRKLYKKTKSIYLGKDHLLCISSGFTEEYKRFYFKDIQAIVACKTSGLITRNSIFGILFGIFFLLAFKAASGNVSLIVYLSVAAVFLSLFIINSFRGSTCVVNLYTAVSTVKLPSLNRIEMAMKVIDILIPIIENAQGTLTSEEIIAKSQEMAEKQASTNNIAHSSTTLPEEVKTQRPLKYYGGKAHEILFYVLLLCGAGSFLNLFFQNITVTLVNMFLGLLLVAATVTALVKQVNTSLRKALKVFTWVTLGYIIISSYIMLFISMIYFSKSPKIYDGFDMITIISKLSPFDNLFLTVFFMAEFTYLFVVGTTGLILLRNFRKKYDLHEKPVYSEQPDSSKNC